MDTISPKTIGEVSSLININSDDVLPDTLKNASFNNTNIIVNWNTHHKNSQTVSRDLKRGIAPYTVGTGNGDPDAMYCLAKCCEDGAGVKRNMKRAFKLYTASANRGNSDAMYWVAKCYEAGAGVKRNMKRAFELYTASANKGNLDAMNDLGLCYQMGKGVSQDVYRAIELFIASTDKGNLRATYNLALCCQAGTGVFRNMDRAIELFTKCASKDNQDAINELIMCYRSEIGVKMDFAIYAELLTRSADQNFDISKRMLMRFYNARDKKMAMVCAKLYGVECAPDMACAKNLYRALFNDRLKSGIIPFCSSRLVRELRDEDWKEIRLMWIGQMKRHTANIIQKLPKDLIKYIMSFITVFRYIGPRLI
jgi:TPR repeat protein